jgi:hypothetical protein
MGMEASAIAALSTSLATQRLQGDVGMAVAKKSIDAQRSTGAALVQLLDMNVGNLLNVSA